jgi:hyperosmotically inducible periplasmic protein
MRTPQLIRAALTLAALTAAVGCNRTQTEQQTQRAAAEVKTAASRAGETIADGWVTTRIQAQYFADEQIKARYIDVTTRDGVVTVKGFVESPAARERALQIARATNGVKQVRDALLIGQSPKAFEAAQPVATSGSSVAVTPETARPDDSFVTSSVQAKFFLDSRVKGRHIDVDTHNNVVTLKGEVASEDERAQALLLARTTAGVERVEDNLTVNAAVDAGGANVSAGTVGQTVPGGQAVSIDASLTDAVKAKLAADAQMNTIDISAKDGVVLLQGTATAAAKQRALTAARETDGALQVVDRIRVKK